MALWSCGMVSHQYQNPADAPTWANTQRRPLMDTGRLWFNSNDVGANWGYHKKMSVPRPASLTAISTNLRHLAGSHNSRPCAYGRKHWASPSHCSPPTCHQKRSGRSKGGKWCHAQKSRPGSNRMTRKGRSAAGCGASRVHCRIQRRRSLYCV